MRSDFSLNSSIRQDILPSCPKQLLIDNDTKIFFKKKMTVGNTRSTFLISRLVDPVFGLSPYYLSPFPRLPIKAMIGYVGAAWGGSFWRV